jgi:hypothetical protein
MYYTASKQKMIMNSGTERSICKQNDSSICLLELGETTNITVRTAGFLSEIRKRDLPNAKQEFQLLHCDGR